MSSGGKDTEIIKTARDFERLQGRKTIAKKCNWDLKLIRKEYEKIGISPATWSRKKQWFVEYLESLK